MQSNHWPGGIGFGPFRTLILEGLGDRTNRQPRYQCALRPAGPTLRYRPARPNGRDKDGRRPSESFIPIAKAKKGGKPAQQEIDFDLTGERRQRNSLINDLRRDVDLWRQRGYERVTPISRKLLQHWADADRENRVLFCQREAAETVIFLAEVAGRYGYRDWRVTLDDANAEHNSGLPRVALKWPRVRARP